MKKGIFSLSISGRFFLAPVLFSLFLLGGIQKMHAQSYDPGASSLALLEELQDLRTQLENVAKSNPGSNLYKTTQVKTSLYEAIIKDIKHGSSVLNAIDDNLMKISNTQAQRYIQSLSGSGQPSPSGNSQMHSNIKGADQLVVPGFQLLNTAQVTDWRNEILSVL